MADETRDEYEDRMLKLVTTLVDEFAKRPYSLSNLRALRNRLYAALGRLHTIIDAYEQEMRQR